MLSVTILSLPSHLGGLIPKVLCWKLFNTCVNTRKYNLKFWTLVLIFLFQPQMSSVYCKNKGIGFAQSPPKVLEQQRATRREGLKIQTQAIHQWQIRLLLQRSNARASQGTSPFTLPCNSRVQGGLFLIRQGRRWHHHNERAGHSDEVTRTEPHRGGASGHDQWGGCWWWVSLSRPLSGVGEDFQQCACTVLPPQNNPNRQPPLPSAELMYELTSLYRAF